MNNLFFKSYEGESDTMKSFSPFDIGK